MAEYIRTYAVRRAGGQTRPLSTATARLALTLVHGVQEGTIAWFK